jgi:hypothetical protein
MKKLFIIIAIFAALPLAAFATAWQATGTNYIANTNTWNINGGDFSGGCWVYYTFATAAESNCLWASSATNNVGFELEVASAAGHFGCDRNKLGIAAQEAATAITVTPKVWYFIGCTYSSSTAALTVYAYNSANETWASANLSASGNGTATKAVNRLNQGQYADGNGGTGDSLQGYVANAFAFNINVGTATLEQYAFKRPPSNASGLIGFWPDNEGGGSVVSDQSPNRFNGFPSSTSGAVATPAPVGPPIQYIK